MKKMLSCKGKSKYIQSFCRSWGLKDSSCELEQGRYGVGVSQEASLECSGSQISQGLCRAWGTDEFNSQSCQMLQRVKGKSVT